MLLFMLLLIAAAALAAYGTGLALIGHAGNDMRVYSAGELVFAFAFVVAGLAFIAGAFPDVRWGS